MENLKYSQKQGFLEGKDGVYHGKKKIRAEYAAKYREAPKAEKTKILDKYLELIGKGNRKYAIYTFL